MQTRQSLLKGDLPCCPVDPKHPIHRHAKYDRYADCQELTKSKWIPRFLCRPCGHTISVLPDDTLSYRPISVPLSEASFDAKAAGKPEPPVTEKERGCLKRAWARLRQRVDVLLAVLGQMIEAVKPSPSEFWNQLRRYGNLEPRIQSIFAGQLSVPAALACPLPWRLIIR